ncbi:UDP-N-acetylmuramoyl-L-alanyl-D-glutamate--2,6-diaminopimelate ligase [Halalkalibacillus halophilus]|uniref:UDP-N-acetylmuramoyl-L-alanyl-D-glutamate--2, 6-diaminopimelate ligase n=1 Tax=Halalkalibacillus halophilus TaxID=392827 RepID=UPI0004152F26|nr:UDP-N-acetylmuramoyl-L-alanyl-D-glutamate--2,6-diaminopimelate ligase [Halalkalibacillus halophilus]
MEITFNNVQQLNIKHLWGPKSQHVVDLSFHSERVQTSSAFFCIKGETSDGHAFIQEAIDSGATTIVGTDHQTLQTYSETFTYITFIVVENIRQSMARLAKHVYKEPYEKLYSIGVTGTNGKTTVAGYVRSLLTLLNMPTGSIGTTGIWSHNEKLQYKKSTPTTPESLDVYRIGRQLLDAGNEAAVMEVSSIALDQYRVDGIEYDVAIHTNLSEEHLEYHGTLDHYRQCKLRLFDQTKAAVVNIDDEGMAEDILRRYQGPLITYSIYGNEQADLVAGDIDVSELGSTFNLSFKGQTCEVFAPVHGDYNVANVLSAIGAALHLDFKLEDILEVLPTLEIPEGRFQVVRKPQNQTVILDYAHTPVALTRLLEEVKKLDYNRLIIMIAGIGIRDFNKMPKMARVIEGKAEEIVVTVDHPGYLDPNRIVDQVLTGFLNPTSPHIHRTLTRGEGVRRALELSGEGDLVLFTGGCINDSQIIKGEEIPHSDMSIIEEYYSNDCPSPS